MLYGTRYVIGILYLGTVTWDGKSVKLDGGGSIVPLAEGFDCEPGSRGQFWEGEKKRWFRKPKRVAVPFAAVGWNFLGQ